MAKVFIRIPRVRYRLICRTGRKLLRIVFSSIYGQIHHRLCRALLFGFWQAGCENKTILAISVLAGGSAVVFSNDLNRYWTGRPRRGHDFKREILRTATFLMASKDRSYRVELLQPSVTVRATERVHISPKGVNLGRVA
jgi:hypothetical protein